MLLPFLKFPVVRKNASRTNNNNNYKDSFFLPILKLFQHLLPRLALVSNTSSNHSSNKSSPFFIPLAKLLGPNKANSGYVPLSLRLEIVKVLSTISITANNIAINTDELTNLNYQKIVLPLLCTLNAKNEIQVDECSYDLEQVIPHLTNLGKHQIWLEMTTDTSSCKQLIPLLYHLMHCLYDEDSVIHRGSFQALKTFIDVVCNQVDASNEHDTIANNPWINVLSTSIVPFIKQGTIISMK